MRQALNDNPVVQAAMIGLLVIAVAFLFMTRVLKGDEGAAEADSATPTATTADIAPSAGDAAAPAAAAPSPAAGADAAGATPAVSAAPDAGVAAAAPGEFTPGKGLPESVVRAHESGDAVAILITRKAGIEDKRLRAMLGRIEGVGRVTTFHTRAHDIARYSQITNGVSVSRVPALVVVHPGKRADAGPPLATVSYGFRGPESAEQALRDALYEGRKDLPYYPE